jgi:hypothetical protein
MRTSRTGAGSEGEATENPDRGVAVRAALATGVGIVLLALALVVASGCGGRSEQSVRDEFATFVAGANQCTASSDCTIVAPGCPLGCQVAVRIDRADAVAAKARDLIHQYESGRMGCSYSCVGGASAICEQNRCALAPETPATGDGGDTSSSGQGDGGP